MSYDIHAGTSGIVTQGPSEPPDNHGWDGRMAADLRGPISEHTRHCTVVRWVFDRQWQEDAPVLGTCKGCGARRRFGTTNYPSGDRRTGSHR